MISTGASYRRAPSVPAGFLSLMNIGSGIICLPLAWALAAMGARLLAQTDPQPNLALGRPVIASGPTWTGFPANRLTDGDSSTISHPLNASGTLGFYFQVDLGGTFRLDRILLANRDDGCCTDRLSNFGVELYADSGGEPGTLNWSAAIRADGSDSGVAGVDTITAANAPTGVFAGRFVRIVNRSGTAYSPQLAEIEVYGGLVPLIRSFAADADTLIGGATATLRWELDRATSATISPGFGPVAATNGFLTFQPTATTTYTLTASNENGTAQATVLIGVDVVLAPPRLSEFMADNSGNLSDEDGDSSDWIEVQNPNPYGLNLEGYYLTDDPGSLGKWQFPGARIPAGGQLVIFASGKNRRDPGAELHTNFKLDAQGDYLALVDRDGVTVLDGYPADFPATKAYPAQRKNLSYGRDPSGTIGFFRPATPGATNGPAFAGIVSDPQFSQDRGFHDTNFSLVLSSATVGAVIRYTTDFSEPTPTKGLVYTDPIAITGTTVMRVAAFRDGWSPTAVDTRTYVFPSNVIASAVMRTTITHSPVYGPQMRAALLDVPSISLVTTATYNDTSEVRTSVEWLNGDGTKGFQVDAGVRRFGGTFQDFAKKSFRIYFRSEYGASKVKYPIFAGFGHGLEAVDEFDQLELRGGEQDMVDRGFYMSNPFTDDTMLDMGRLNTHGRFVHLYLNGTYWGLYHLRERWGAAMHVRYLGGAHANYESINGNYNVGGWAEPGSPYDGDGSTWALVKSLRSHYAAVKPWVDVPQFTDYMIMWLFGGSEDEFRCVGPNVPGSGFKFLLNDADGWLCVPNYCASGDRTARGAPGRLNGDGPGSLFSMLVKEGDPEFRTLLADRMHQALFHDGALTPGQNAARLLQRTREIERPFYAEAARWNYLTPLAWAGRRDAVLNNWFPRRTAEALTQFRAAGLYPTLDAPEMAPHGGVVGSGYLLHLTGPVGAVIHFTLDGSDPRLPGGAVSPTARTFATGGASETLVPAGARWRWYTDATGLGSSDVVEGQPGWSTANWKHPGFADEAWSEGPAQLGYGEGDEATVLPFGPDPQNKWTTSYFRHRFTLADTNGITALTLRLKRDDGAIVYVNGREAARSSIRSGPVVGTTPGDGAADDGQAFNALVLATGLLQSGDNLVAVELHQATPGTSDASFDLELVATRSVGGPGNPLPSLTGNTVVKCRSRQGDEWSALNEAFFQVDPDPVGSGGIAFTELNYNPAGDDGTEFVELTNLGSHAANLRGAQFTEGIHHVFPDNRDTLLAPGQRLVLVRDLFRFQQRYGFELPVDGIYSGQLADGGERLTLVSAANQTITAVTYSDAAPWPAEADGAGYTLVLVHPELGQSNPLAWRASVATNGTPGGTDSVAFVGEPGADADHDGVPALLEFAFGTSDLDPASGPGAVTIGFDAEQRFTITFPHRLGADGLSVSVEASADLTDWFPATLLAVTPSGGRTRWETWGVLAAAHEAQFLRIRVTQP